MKLGNMCSSYLFRYASSIPGILQAETITEMLHCNTDELSFLRKTTCRASFPSLDGKYVGRRACVWLLSQVNITIFDNPQSHLTYSVAEKFDLC